MMKCFWVAVLSCGAILGSGSPQGHAQTSTTSEKWFVLPDGKSAITILKLNQIGDSITGQWLPPKGDACEIENGKFAGDVLTFSFTQENKRFEATGHISGRAMSVDLIGPGKRGRPQTIHGQAARADN